MISFHNYKEKFFNSLLLMMSLVTFALLFLPFSENTQVPASLFNDTSLENSISVEKALQMYKYTDDVLFLDVREDMERDLGFVPGSLHIRRSDLFSTEWKNLPDDKTSVVLCYSGARASEVTEYLNSVGIDSVFVEGGINEWHKEGGGWTGDLSLSHNPVVKEVYSDLKEFEIKQRLSEGAVLVDTREQRHYEWWHIPGSYSFPAYFISRDEFDSFINAIPKDKEVILFCDGISRSCFSSIVAGLVLMENGYSVLGKFSHVQFFKSM